MPIAQAVPWLQQMGLQQMGLQQPVQMGLCDWLQAGPEFEHIGNAV